MNDRDTKKPSSEVLTKSLLDSAVESWRFTRTFGRVLNKLDAGEKERYLGQVNWFMKKLEGSLRNAQLEIKNIEGRQYDPGMAVTPLNIAEFDPKDILLVDQMLEPIIMGTDGAIIRMGKVMLRREQP